MPTSHLSRLKSFIRIHQNLFLALFALILSLSLAALIIFIFRHTGETTSTLIDSSFDTSIVSPSPSAEDNLDHLNILLIGHGGAGHPGGSLADALLLVNLDFTRSHINLISLPRDLAVTYPDGQTRKLNTSLSLDFTAKDPHFTITKQVASAVTNLPIDYVIAVNFVGFQRVIGEELGTIEVDVQAPYQDNWYPILSEAVNPCGKSPEEIAELTRTLSGFELEKQFPCRYKQISFSPGIRSMDGGTALEYARSRHGSSDFDRSRRQREIALGIFKKLFSLQALDNLPQFYSRLSVHVSTDLSLSVLEHTRSLLALLPDFQVHEIGLSTDNVLTSSSQGGTMLVPRESWPAIHTFISTQTSAE